MVSFGFRKKDFMKAEEEKNRNSHKLLNIPDYERIPLKTNFLSQVLCQVKFYEILKITDSQPAEFQDMIRDAYPVFQEVIPQQIDIGPDFFSGIRPALNEKMYLFSSKTSKWRVELKKDRLTLSTTEYDSFSEFRERFVNLVNALEKCYKNISYTYLGLRYVDQIKKEAVETGKDWDSVINPNLLGLTKEYDSKGKVPIIFRDNFREHFQRLVLFDEESGKQMLYQFGVPFIGKTEEFVMDVDCSFTNAFKLEEISEMLVDLHNETYNIFRWSLKQEFLEQFKLEENKDALPAG